MDIPVAPYHQQQILDALPDWIRQLHPTHASRVMRRAHNEHIKPNGHAAEWFKNASPQQKTLLRQAIRARRQCHKVFAKAVSELKTLPGFCAPLLQKQLGISAPVGQAQYCFQPFQTTQVTSLEQVSDVEAYGSIAAVTPPQWVEEPVGEARVSSLLEAAMHNFEGMSEVGPFSTLQVSATDETALTGLSVARFVTQCRALDLGNRYQAHLDSIFLGTRKAQVQTAWIAAHRAELTVQAVRARMQGRLGEQGYQALRHFCIDGVTPHYGKRPVTLRTLKLLGVPIQDLLLIGPQTGDDEPVIAYLPFDDDCPVKEFTSLDELERHLCQHLLDPEFRLRLLEHVAQPDRPKLASALQEALYEDIIDFQLPPGLVPLEPTWPASDNHPAVERVTRKKPRLGMREQRITAPYWTALYEDHVRFLKGNARAIAVPTADVDARARKERLEHWEENAMNLLNVAAMFVPGLDTVMLAVFAAQIMGNVFHAYEAWSDGDNAEAVAQVESLALTLGSAVAIGVGAAVVKASGFVDALKSIRIDGEQRLWHPQLSGYRSPIELPAGLEADAEGIRHHDARHYLALDGDTYEVEQDPEGQWRLRHPDEPSAYRPRLLGNGKGAWRLEHERVQDWNPTKLLRRLGPISSGLSDADLLAALDSTGLNRGALEPVFADGEHVPPLLEDALVRLNKDLEVDEIINRTRDGGPLAAYKSFAAATLTELPGWPEEVAIEVFDGPEAWGSVTRYGQALAQDPAIALSRDVLDEGKLASAVLGHLDEAQITALLPEGTPPARRPQALQELLADQLSGKRPALFNSLYKGQRAPLTPAAEILGRQFPSLPNEALEEIIGHCSNAERKRLLTGRVPLRIGEEARAMQARVRLDRAILGLQRASLANDDSALIRNGLLAEHPLWTPQQVLRAAQTDRAKASRLLGQQPIRPGYRSPLHLSDGRYGYPLSPVGNLTREEQELHALYPGMTAVERRQFLATLRQRGNVAAQLQAMHRELATLREGLADWALRCPPQQQRHANQLAGTLIRAWHRLGDEHLSLYDYYLDSLPPLTTRFDHIRSLHLENLEVPAIPADYLQSFPSATRLSVRSSPSISMESLFDALRHAPQLVELNIFDCELAYLPVQAYEVLPRLEGLRALRLQYNDLTLTEEGLVALIERHRLQVLDLSCNRIELDAAMAQRFTALTELRSLDLAENPLGSSPSLQNLQCLTHLSLDYCQLTAWPEGLQALMANAPHALRQVSLNGNQIAHVPNLDSLLDTPFIQALLMPDGDEAFYMNYNPLDEATRRELRAAGVVLERSVEPELLPGQQPHDWLFPDSPARQTLWDDLFADDANSDLRRAVEQAGLSRAARAAPESMARQVWSLLGSAAADDELRRRLDEVASGFPVSCGDAGADVLSTLQIEAEVFEMTAGQPRADGRLFTYFRRLYRRSQVNELAQEIYSARVNRRLGLQEQERWEASPPSARGPRPQASALHRFDHITNEVLLDGQGMDLIEIRLLLRTNLAHELDFPEPQTQMLYRQAARIIGPTEEAVRVEVQLRDANPAARQRWVSHHASWRRVLRQQFQARLETLASRWNVGTEFLEWCLHGSEMEGTLETPVIDALTSTLGESPLDGQGRPRRLEIDSNRYVAGMNRLKQGLEDDEDALFLELTRPMDDRT